MPLEIPGNILKELPDRSSLDTCSNCRRPYFKLKMSKKDGYIDLHCPYCGNRISRRESKEAVVPTTTNKSQVRAPTIPRFETKEAEDLLIKPLREDPDPRVREQAIELISKYEVSVAVPELINILRDDDDPNVLESAAGALGNFYDVSAVPTLIERLQDGNAKVRYRVALALGQIGDISAVPPLLERLDVEEEYPYVQVAVATSLGKLGDETAIEPLLRLYFRTEFDSVQEEIANALGVIGKPAAIDTLSEMLQHKNYQIRLNATSGFAHLPNSKKDCKLGA
jgi:HEAT repeat protein/DNA-directed RNA polymerase subunit RPC12/RpoP